MASAGLPVLICRLGSERYAIELKELAEVVPFRDCTPVPGGSPVFLGVINLRAVLRPVVDLHRVLAGKAGGESGFVVMLKRQTGLRVDEI